MPKTKKTKGTSKAWNERLEELKQYKQVNGNCKVKRNYVNQQLANWVHNQRNKYKNGTLSNEQTDHLNGIGFEWEVKKQDNEQYWDERFEELKQYEEQNGHCNVPREYKHNKQLGKWVARQRTYGVRKNTEEQISRLNSIGFKWVLTVSWDERVEELKQYKQDNGDCNVPQHYEANPHLGKWVSNKRTAYKNGTLSKEHICLLEDIGFNWFLVQGCIGIPIHLKVLCSVEGCTRKACDSGMCDKEHGGYNYCDFDGCENIRVKSGLCIKHGACGYCTECGGKNDRSGMKNSDLCISCWSKKVNQENKKDDLAREEGQESQEEGQVMQEAEPLPSLPVEV